MVVASLILSVAIFWLFVTSTRILQQQTDMNSIISIRDNIQALQTSLSDMQSDQRMILLSGSKISIQSFAESKANAEHGVENLRKSASLLPIFKPQIEKNQPRVREAIDLVGQSIDLKIKGERKDLGSILSSGSKAMFTQRDELTKLDQDLREKNLSIAQDIKRSLQHALIGAVVVLATIIFILYFSYRRSLQLFEDAIQSRRLADELNHLATHDALTRLANRRSFDDNLRRTLATCKRYNKMFGLFYMDLDGFKSINDKYGHDVGDEVLCEVSKRLSACLRESEILARIGGDEFALIVHHFDDIIVLNYIACRIIYAISQPIVIKGKTLEIGISIGIAHYPAHGIFVEEIVSAADSSMFTSKRNGKNQFTFAGQT
jgi:diguanylate cyclase